MRIVGSSQNPAYNIRSVSAKHFERSGDGKRLAPVSQMNTFRGRELARAPSLTGDIDQKVDSGKNKRRTCSFITGVSSTSLVNPPRESASVHRSRSKGLYSYAHDMTLGPSASIITTRAPIDAS